MCAVRELLGSSSVDEVLVERLEWLESLDWVMANRSPQEVLELLRSLLRRAQRAGVPIEPRPITPYLNTIPRHGQAPFPGNRDLERRIKSLIRWNAMAMVVRANRDPAAPGGHISTYASAATLFEVGFNHFFRAAGADFSGDLLFIQGHASPGVYARAFLEGRLSQEHLAGFRRELSFGKSLPSYPHPRVLPDFWQFPTVSMGLGPLLSIYQARFNRYLENRGLKSRGEARVWGLFGDGEMDETESVGALSLAARDGLDNLTWVVNCNLQRLDGPVRGNGKIIQELEGIFRGAGWNVIKVIWGSDWDALLEKDAEGELARRMEEIVDGEMQKYSVSDGAYIREHFFGKSDALLRIVEGLSDEQLRRLNRGGHDPEKVYAAYAAAVATTGQPTVVLAQTIKGYGLGEAGEGKNVTHQQKKLNEVELREFRTRFGVPIDDEEVDAAPFYRPAEDSPELQYLQERRRELGGFLPQRRVRATPLSDRAVGWLHEFRDGTGERPVATTMALVRVLTQLLRDEEIGKLVVPIIPDEAQSFGMDALFRRFGVYSPKGQLYEPVDQGNLSSYREAVSGQILEEGITEAGAMSSFITAGTAYATHGINTIPFFVYYSMFGLQRVGDLVWLAGDIMCKGFLVGGTAGRTSLAGEGLQHADGNSQLLAYPVPSLVAYDPAFGYEIEVIVEDGIRRMYAQQEDVFFYLTVQNEKYTMPAMPEGSRDGILKGMYRLRPAQHSGSVHVHLFGAGAIVNMVLEAQQILAADHDIAADVWSITSFKELHRDGLATERWNRLHPADAPRRCYVQECLDGTDGVYVIASDYVRALPESIARWFPRPPVSLGTDGFGRSDGRDALRRHFEVDGPSIAYAALAALARSGEFEKERLAVVADALSVDCNKTDPSSVDGLLRKTAEGE